MFAGRATATAAKPIRTEQRVRGCIEDPHSNAWTPSRKAGNLGSKN
jgi:hypothetical protein